MGINEYWLECAIIFLSSDNLRSLKILFLLFLTSFLFVCFLFMATLVAYGSSPARGLIRTTAAGLPHSHSNAGSKQHLQLTPQLTAMPDP